MAVKIRLNRMGAKKNPFYRIVVADSRAPRDGRFIEILGNYDPSKQPAVVNIDEEKAIDWMQKGAQPTDGKICRGKAQEGLRSAASGERGSFTSKESLSPARGEERRPA